MSFEETDDDELLFLFRERTDILINAQYEAAKAENLQREILFEIRKRGIISRLGEVRAGQAF